MSEQGLQVVTGAFGYSGRHIATELLQHGFRVRTLTNSPPAVDPFDGRVEVHPLAFDDPGALEASLQGAQTLYNTYWVRFNHVNFSHALAVDNTLKLFAAARKAGVRRMVHVSITNPTLNSPFEYFRGKAQLEQALRNSGLSHAILRPAVLFGKEDILINNIAWVLRSFPVFGVFGDGQYGIQPIYIEDFAKMAVELGQGKRDLTIDAVGPESFSYRGLVKTLGEIINCRKPIISIPPSLGLWIGRGIGFVTRDIVITREEIGGLMAGLLEVNSPPTGTTRLTDWAHLHRQGLGVRYASELARRKR